ncbi:MAG: hypothetical protein LBF93_04865 [Zoogloeaceae bacterium]|jgi:hypothetical protein|nr:hypothetical protein [Zoogloeaceae bacterium]
MNTSCTNAATAFLLALALIAPVSLAAPKQTALPVPPSATPEIIAHELRFNGAPMRIVRFATADADDTLKFYRRYFVDHAREGKYTEKGSARRKMIGALMQDKQLINVEMTSAGERTFHVTVSSLDIFQMEIPEKLARDIPRMPGSKVVQHQDSRDGAKSNRFVIVQNNQSVEGNAMYLREHYIRQGWRRDSDETIEAAAHRQLGFSKEDRQLRINIKKTGRDMTLIIHNEMKE